MGSTSQFSSDSYKARMKSPASCESRCDYVSQNVLIYKKFSFSSTTLTDKSGGDNRAYAVPLKNTEKKTKCHFSS